MKFLCNLDFDCLLYVSCCMAWVGLTFSCDNFIYRVKIFVAGYVCALVF